MRKCNNKHIIAGKNIYHTVFRVKVVIGTPSSVFQTLADPSLEVEAKNSESRLEQNWTNSLIWVREETILDLLQHIQFHHNQSQITYFIMF